MIASCEISARALDLAFDANEHREWLRTGEVSLQEMQEYTDDLHLQRDERERRRR